MSSIKYICISVLVAVTLIILLVAQAATLIIRGLAAALVGVQMLFAFDKETA